MSERQNDGLAALQEQFQLREELFEHGDFTARVILPVSSDDLIDASELNTDERLPYWAELWPSARALARQLLDSERLPGSLIELGCGVALPSMAAAWKGAAVTATDYYADALRFASVNASRNGVHGLQFRELDWRDSVDDLNPAELVIAADVLYESRNVDPVARAIERLTEPGGQAWVADPRRSYFSPFLEKMISLGWIVAHRVDCNEHPMGDSTITTVVTIVQLERR